MKTAGPYFPALLVMVMCNLQNFSVAEPTGPSVEWQEGTGTRVIVEGSWRQSLKNSTFASFQGIPYAAPPVGKLRFSRPQPQVLEGSTIHWNATQTSLTQCPQPPYQSASMSEDCLYLNIYSPALPPSTPALPVMVWIHGGSFMSGSGTWPDHGPLYFMEDHGVLLVTVNYRLGPLGFLSLGNSLVPGNMGLWDQNMALKWIQGHIQYFGGDPTQVTVFGESAGSWGLMYHLLSKSSTGLFHRLIGQSGSPLSPSWGWISGEKAEKYGDIFLDRVGCRRDDMECMQNIEIHVLMGLIDLIDDPTDKIISGNPWNGVVDRDFTDDPFLPGSPSELLESGEFNTEVEVILGMNKDEGLGDTMPLLFQPQLFDEIAEHWPHYGPIVLLDKTGLGDITEDDISLSTKILDYYVGFHANFNLDHFAEITDMKTDSTFWFGIHKTIRLLVSHGVPVYQYMLSYRGERSLIDLYYPVEEGKYGVSHADDLFYLFEPVFQAGRMNLNEDDLAVSEVMVKAWTDFAKFGDPSPPGGGSLSWTPVNMENHQYLDIDGPNPGMKMHQEYTDRMAFWETLNLV